MITELKLANFKAFAEEVQITFRPITFLTGAAGIGKSTILDFLQLLAQSKWPASPGPLQPNGNTIILGRLQDLRNVHLQSDLLEFSITAGTQQHSGAHSLTHPSARGQASYREPKSDTTSIISLMDNDHNQKVLSYDANADEVRSPNLTALLETLTAHLSRITRVSAHEKYDERHTTSLGITLKAPPEMEFAKTHIQAVAGISSITFHDDNRMATAVNGPADTNTPLHHKGTGITRSVRAILEGAAAAPGDVVAMEHPEQGLHPQAQLEMGEFFGQLWRERGVSSVIETHSDNLLLRVRRLVAQGKLDPEDVSIAFFNQQEERTGPAVTNISLDGRGSLSPGLPMSFFGASVIDAIHMGAGE